MSPLAQSKKTLKNIFHYSFFIAVIFVFTNSFFSAQLKLSGTQFLLVDFIFSALTLSFFIRHVELTSNLVNNIDHNSHLARAKRWLYANASPLWRVLFIISLMIILISAVLIKYIPLFFGHTITAFIMGGCLLSVGIFFLLASCHHWHIREP